jgi:hypothetical protein
MTLPDKYQPRYRLGDQLALPPVTVTGLVYTGDEIYYWLQDERGGQSLEPAEGIDKRALLVAGENDAG